MKVKSAEFLISAASSKQYPNTGYPEIALAGRSNVGKSSFINKLIGRKNLVRTSSKPGKTRTLNYYTINESFYFVDVPGYGYAKVSKQERAKWAEMMQEYFEKRDKLNAVVLIIDGRHTPTNDDLQMVEYIQYLQVKLQLKGPVNIGYITICKSSFVDVIRQQMMIYRWLNISNIYRSL